MDLNGLNELAKHLRLETVRMIYEGKDGHPGPALSIADIVTALYFDIMNINPQNPTWEDRDRFILSKGHACPIYYTALNEKGYFGDKISNFNLRALGSIFQGHPVMRTTPGVDMTSGSLGNGISIGAGMAIAGKLNKKSYNVYIIVGDGELQEGVVWEGINVAAAHKLDNMIVFVDDNNWQSGGAVDKTIGSRNIKERFESFCWDVQEIDGHDISMIQKAVKVAKNTPGKPHAIVCKTIKGKGVDFMENNNAWHKGVPTDAEFESIMAQLGGRV